MPAHYSECLFNSKTISKVSSQWIMYLSEEYGISKISFWFKLFQLTWRWAREIFVWFSCVAWKWRLNQQKLYILNGIQTQRTLAPSDFKNGQLGNLKGLTHNETMSYLPCTHLISHTHTHTCKDITLLIRICWCSTIFPFVCHCIIGT